MRPSALVDPSRLKMALRPYQCRTRRRKVRPVSWSQVADCRLLLILTLAELNALRTSHSELQRDHQLLVERHQKFEQLEGPLLESQRRHESTNIFATTRKTRWKMQLNITAFLLFMCWSVQVPGPVPFCLPHHVPDSLCSSNLFPGVQRINIALEASEPIVVPAGVGGPGGDQPSIRRRSRINLDYDLKRDLPTGKLKPDMRRYALKILC